jgi:hypothetical protein
MNFESRAFNVNGHKRTLFSILMLGKFLEMGHSQNFV